MGEGGKTQTGSRQFSLLHKFVFHVLAQGQRMCTECECIVVQLQPQNEATVIANHVKAALPVPDKRTN